jgi:EAL domain-containing protein (putative c-di-GMP-specific phosphodiesterase class I)
LIKFRHNRYFSEIEELDRIFESGSLDPVFQPILQIDNSKIFGFEGLTRGPTTSLLHLPAQLFAAGNRAGLLIELEMLCCRKVVRQFSRIGAQGNLFLNVSPQTVLWVREDIERISNFIVDCGMQLEQTVIELTEHQHITDHSAFHRALKLFRAAGFRVAIDDLGEGFSSLRLWSELRPDFVKIDIHFIQGISRDPLKLQFLKSLQQIAIRCETELVAEGVEDIADFRVLRDLGISYAQGHLIERPSKEPNTIASPASAGFLLNAQLAAQPRV